MFLGQNVIISSEEAQKIISYCEPLLEKSKLRNTSQSDSFVDNVNSNIIENKRISSNALLKIMPSDFGFLPELRNAISQFSNFTLKEDVPIKTNIIKYPTGGFLFKHDDTYHDGLRLVGVGNLNESYEGGLFKTDEEDLNIGTGNVAWFLPNLKHEVTKVTKGERWSIVFWLFNENLITKKVVI